jgi:acyl-CoA dehydrogenase
MTSGVKKLEVLDWLLSTRGEPIETRLPSLNDWKKLFVQYSSNWEEPIDCAIMGGFIGDRTAYAFASGYKTALYCLMPSLPLDQIVALCVTEEGGAHPRAIHAKLEEVAGHSDSGSRWRMSGIKRFATMADEADLFMVAASMGIDSEGKNHIRLVLIERDAKGITVEPMDDIPFIKEISHGVIRLENVEVEESQLLPGDGYERYIKPFRTIEDLHVLAAILGYLFRVASLYDWPRSCTEQMLSLLVSVRALALADPAAPEVHIAIGGFQKQMDDFLITVEPYWSQTDEETRAGWERDSALMQVAGGDARAKRLERAWTFYE